MSLIRDERGTTTAEFAVVVPAAVLIVALAAGTLQAVGRQVRLEQGAAQAARLAARGDDGARASLGVSGAAVSVRHEGDLVCADATAPTGVPLPLPPLRATSCALAGGL